MAVAPGMKGTVEEIERSHKARAQKLKEIRSEARTVLDTSRKLMLTVSACRKKASAELKTKLSADIAGLQDDTARLIRGYADARHASETRDRAARLSEVRSIRQEVSIELRKTDELVLKLRKSRKESGAMMAVDRARERQRIAAGTAGLLGEAIVLMKKNAARRKRAGEILRDSLNKHNRAARIETHEMLDGFRESRERVQSDLRMTAQIWRGSRRAGFKEPSEKGMRAGDSSVEETSTAAKAEAASAEGANLEAKVLAVVLENPTGVNLGEIASRIGVHSVALGRPIKNLLERQAVRKEDKLYFPVNAAAGDM